MSILPYPMRAARIAIEIMPFGFWLRPRWHRRKLTEAAKEQGETIWYVRWAWFQVSYSRWV